ncbi:trans-sulfuration enzyme family protein [Sulfobacillus harzensis]|uniref:trans-sulfuration enzyme family protein n=1 Tax=Sulfobacillus harzensis TaxID=2729629 RepID=UPI001A9B4FD5|nr:PLP-dependent aspartate aminotransferase family protein [Sulfobacillus harzensis]
MPQEPGFNTRAIHVGQDPDPITGATVPPLYLTSTFTQPELGRHLGYEYGRNDNPTRQSLEEALASLEQGQGAVAYASGMAASDAVLRLLSPGGRVLAAEDLYGGVYRLLERVYRGQGILTEYVDPADLDALASAIQRYQPQMLWLESPSNPLLKVFDIAQAAKLAHHHGTLLVVDNTFASPYNQNPLALGADLVVHSTTKYIGGHSDVIGGAVVARDETLLERLRFLRNTAGATLGPFEAWLTLRGLKTLGVRMERHAANAARIQAFLQRHPRVERVYYPADAGALASQQMRTMGGMVSFVLKPTGSQDPMVAVKRVMDSFRVFSLAESLGGVESLAGHPSTMTHAAVPNDERRRRGIVDTLIRLSVGIEDVEDLVADLDLALNEANPS